MMEVILKIYEYVDKLARSNGKSIVEILNENDEQKIIDLLDPKIVEILNENNIFEEFIYFLDQVKYNEQSRIIQSVSDRDLDFAKRKTSNYSLPSDEIKLIFESLKRNLEIYEKLYMGKVYKLETTLNRTVLLNIGHAKLFHLLGFDFYSWRKHYRREILSVIPEMKELLSKDYPTMCKDNDPALIRSILAIIEREEDILSAIDSKKLSDKIFTSPKIKTKNFAFERLGLIESPTGIMFYTKPSKNNIHIHSDVFLLRDFLRDYKLNWIFSGYRNVELNDGNISPIKNAETLLIESDDSSRFDKQIVGISSAVGSMNKSQFDFKVSTLSSTDDPGVIIETDVEFDPIDIKLMARKIIDKFPNLDLAHLKDIVNSNSGPSNKI